MSLKRFDSFTNKEINENNEILPKQYFNKKNVKKEKGITDTLLNNPLIQLAIYVDGLNSGTDSSIVNNYVQEYLKDKEGIKNI